MPSFFKQIERALAEVATWSSEKRQSVQLEGNSDFIKINRAEQIKNAAHDNSITRNKDNLQ